MNPVNDNSGAYSESLLKDLNKDELIRLVRIIYKNEIIPMVETIETLKEHIENISNLPEILSYRDNLKDVIGLYKDLTTMNLVLPIFEVENMHKKFNISSEEVPFSPEEKKFRIACMLEEVNEYQDSNTPQDELDALIDLVVFALGTAERQGFLHIFKEAFSRVIEANMKKELGGNAKRGSFQLDMVKPQNWQAPNFDDLFPSS